MKAKLLITLVVLCLIFGCSRPKTVRSLGPLNLPITITNAIVLSEGVAGEKTWILKAQLSQSDVQAIVNGLYLNQLPFDLRLASIVSVSRHLPAVPPGGTISYYAGHSTTAPGSLKLFVTSDGRIVLILEQV